MLDPEPKPTRDSSDALAAVVPPPSGTRPAERVSPLLERLVLESYTPTWRLLRRLGVRLDQADDAAQHVFLVAAERIGDIQPGKERSFLYGTALRVAKHLQRRRGRDAVAESVELTDQRLGADELLERKRACDVLDEALGALDVELRSVLVLYELEGLSGPEIAEIEQIPVGTVASRLRRARREFRRELKHIELARKVSR
jgi:RNA polymerase sigma-70 factor (ECF subfamily)